MTRYFLCRVKILEIPGLSCLKAAEPAEGKNIHVCVCACGCDSEREREREREPHGEYAWNSYVHVHAMMSTSRRIIAEPDVTSGIHTIVCTYTCLSWCPPGTDVPSLSQRGPPIAKSKSTTNRTHRTHKRGKGLRPLQVPGLVVEHNFFVLSGSGPKWARREAKLQGMTSGH